MAQDKTQEIHQEFEKLLQTFSKEIGPHLRDNLKDLNYVNSGRLGRSYRANLKENSDHNWDLEFQMLEYGRIIEKIHGGFAPYASAEDLARWIEFIGLSRFRFIPGYENSSFIPAKAASRVAWAIIGSGMVNGSKQKWKIDTQKRDRRDPIFWSPFYKPFYAMWNESRDELLQVYFDKVPENILSEVKGTYQSAVDKMAKSVVK